jgi:photosystem II stability/assembly factor-like uncharacterized protein
MKISTVVLILSIFSVSESIAQIENEDNPKERIEHEIRITIDPKLGRVPYERLIQEREKLSQGLKNHTINTAISGLNWHERGPNNIGGRTRALMFDPNDATKKRVFAGGVGGGLWYNNDITSAASTWTKIDDFWANISISCMAFNPANTQIFYVGTGEGWYNGDALEGAGVYKTTNGGTTWSLLASTTTGGANANAFKYTQKIVVNSFGEVFAATQSGVLKSTDGGVTWSVSLIGSSFASDLEIASDGVIYAAFGRFGQASGIYKSTNQGVSWSNITPDANQDRVEIALAPSTSGATQVIYAMAQSRANYNTAWIKKSTDAGASWTDINNPDLTSNQAWYDMILAVHPTNSNLVIGGGNVIGRTTDGGASWVKQGYGYPHPDQHAIVFRPNATNEVIIGNDGGVIYSSDYGNSADTSPLFETRNNGYNVTQFYGISMKNLVGDGYVVGGTQDNNTLKITSAENIVGNGINVNGGDGIASFIDQNEPTIALVSSQYGYYDYLNTSTDAHTDLGVGSNQFITTADYDSQNNTFYSDKNDGQEIWRVKNVGGAFSTNSYSTGTSSSSFIRAGTTQYTIFVGTHNSQVHKIVNFGEASQARTIVGSFPWGSISSISIGVNENELLVTISNYGVTSVYYTNNGGTTWVSKDDAAHGLPDVPIRYGIFNPQNRKQVLLATDLGVWSSTDITASNPGWGVTNAGLANVSCYQLYVRTSDNTVAVATHGRGIYTTKLPVCPTNIVRAGNETGAETVLSGTYIKGNTANVIQTGANKTYSAKNYVLLEPKFETQSGSVFKALIGGCN